ncbi:isocitrate/isopropylmalate family dehydrogenase [Amycolatopsis magusensis]|uniref:isocitrate/isopropylmalate family dehydrogenase n=1 Tax=Amycolatopsis magusensis TaxID=882444 RepID=UPI0037A58001
MPNPVVGLAVGRGTGPELAEVFERVLRRLGELHAVEFDVVRSPRAYHSYVSLRAESVERIRRHTQQDAEHYEHFCRTLAARGTEAVFRTAINAQSLYLVRQRLRAVKVDLIDGQDSSLLLVRDEAQGFYTGENSHTPGVVTRTMEFSREITGEIVAFALRRARRHWPDGGADQVLMAYKFHLLDGALDEWVTALSRRHGVDIRLCQPDTVNRNLIEQGLPARTLVIASNEWADIMHVVLLDKLGGERQENRFTENAHLHPAVSGLVEYQTVHGSADDLAGRDAVNPVATVRAAAAIAQRHGGCANAVRTVERALDTIWSEGAATADAGGRHSTTALVEALLDVLEPQAEPVPG